MKILLSNDDGVFAPGLYAVAEALMDNHELYIVAPSSERSGASHSFTMRTPLRADVVELKGINAKAIYSVSGTPVDCVKLALGNLVPKPDIIISGINNGANRGTDVLYSGTVAAAMEGATVGIPSIAVSNVGAPATEYGAAVLGMKKAIEIIVKSQRQLLLNVNAPNVAANEAVGFKLTSLSKQIYEPAYIERVDPYGGKYYWTPSTRLNVSLPTDDDDERWTVEGYITITPLIFGLTDLAELKRMENLMS